MIFLFTGKAVVMDGNWVSSSIEDYSAQHFGQLDRAVRTSSRIYIAPEVIKLKGQDKVFSKKLNLTSQTVYLRDSFTCQYCGCGSDLTIDHVIPRSRIKEFGLSHATSWENVVACCFPCNSKKANRTPDEAGMPLLSKPIKPTSSLKFKFGETWKESWHSYIAGAKI